MLVACDVMKSEVGSAAAAPINIQSKFHAKRYSAASHVVQGCLLWSMYLCCLGRRGLGISSVSKRTCSSTLAPVLLEIRVLLARQRILGYDSAVGK